MGNPGLESCQTSVHQHIVQTTPNKKIVKPMKCNPQKIKFCVLNSRSVCNKAQLLNDFCVDNEINVLCITETWLQGNITDSPTIVELCANNFVFHHNPRCSRRGGGVGILVDKSFSCKRASEKTFKSFECMEVHVSGIRNGVTICIIYRPPATSLSTFSIEFEEYVTSIAIKTKSFLLVGDFNIHVETNDNAALVFNNLIASLGLQQYVDAPTHHHGHILDLVISSLHDSLVENVEVLNYQISDHFPVICNININRKKAGTKVIHYRDFRRIDRDTFIDECMAQLPEDLHTLELERAVHCYNSILQTGLEHHAPLTRREINPMKHVPWFTEQSQQLKRVKRRKERAMLKHMNHDTVAEYKSARNDYLAEVKKSKVLYYHEQINASSKNPRKLYSLLNELLDPCYVAPLPTYTDPSELADRFTNFFLQKIYGASQ